MAITIELPPEEEQRLRQRAELAGQDVGTYLLRNAGLAIVPPPLADEEWEALLDEIGDTVPPDATLLSDYAVSREGMYEERDAQLMGDVAVDPSQI